MGIITERNMVILFYIYKLLINKYYKKMIFNYTYSLFFMKRAGTPAQISYGGIDLFTTDPAAITDP